MGVTSERLPTQLTRPRTAPSARSGLVLIAYGITFILAALAIHQIVGSVIGWGQVKFDDLRYGRPRTMHLNGVVGHGDSADNPTHFIALNLQRQVVVLELPGGDATNIRSLPGPYLFGDNQELTPVNLSLRDVDRDKQPDLLIVVQNEQVVYLNKDGAFRLPTGDEQRHIQHVIKESGP
jgi:hypothetical protein